MFAEKSLSTRFLAVPIALALAGGAGAQIQHLEALSIDGAQECAVVTAATGSGNFVLDVGTNTFHYSIAFGGLSSAQTLGHIHGPAAPCVPGGVMFTLPLGSPICGSFASTPAQAANIAAGMTYVNIHTTNFGGGEIRGQILPSPAIGTPSCFGDTTSPAPCPCGNFGIAGHGCDNSAGTGGALLKASGHNSPDNVVLICEGELATVLSIFLQGNATIAPIPFGDGLRCVGGSLKRIGVRNAFNGWVAYPIGCDLSITLRSAALGDPIAPGTSRGYQTYYRDPVLAFCPTPTGSSFNVSNAVDIAW